MSCANQLWNMQLCFCLQSRKTYAYEAIKHADAAINHADAALNALNELNNYLRGTIDTIEKEDTTK